MLVFVTCRGHSYTVAELVERTLGHDVPHCAATSYDVLLRSDRTARAVHIFTDFERLSAPELRHAADLCRSLRAAGIPCLNDPARVMTRYELLANLQEAGINPFGAYRADGLPKPKQFPVFVRREGDHDGPLSDLLSDQEELDRTLQSMRERGVPLRGHIVIEFAGEQYVPNLWRKFSTFRVGPNFSVHLASVSQRWAVKGMDMNAPREMYAAELEAVAEDVIVDTVRRAFDIAGIEWGRADHSVYRGRHVIYEINTNPTVLVGTKELPIREASMKLAVGRLAGLLREIDSGDGAPVEFGPIQGFGPRKPRKGPFSWLRGKRRRGLPI